VRKFRNEAVQLREKLVPILKRLPSYTKLILALLRDPDITSAQKGLLLSGLGYAVSPVDLIPGFIPVAGQLDDLVVILAALNKVLDSAPQSVEKHLKNLKLNGEIVSEDLKTSKELLKNIGKASFKTSKRAFSKILSLTHEKIIEAYTLINRVIISKTISKK